jgi:CheY-like chemotaxis protein
MQPSPAILIVDDHDGFRTFARHMLEAAGFTVAEAATGAEATEVARTVRPAQRRTRRDYERPLSGLPWLFSHAGGTTMKVRARTAST